MTKAKQIPDPVRSEQTELELRRKAASREFERVVAYHRRWLDARKLLNRPWFILGSAPGPTIPERFPAETVMVYAKYAGHSAKKFGLPDADITFLLGKTLPEQVAGLHTGHVLRLDNELTFKARVARLCRFTGVAEGEIDHVERDLFIVHELGSLFPERRDKRPSNGLALICYALAVQIPQIIITGISLDSDGHEYRSDVRERRHRGPDRQALTAIAQRFSNVVTSEASLHQHTGLPLLA